MLEWSWADVERAAERTAAAVQNTPFNVPADDPLRIYGVPRGGVYAAQAVRAAASVPMQLVSEPVLAHLYVDDLVDSGSTRNRMFSQYGVKPFFSLLDKKVDGVKDWIQFPWEIDNGETAGVEDNIRRILQYIGEDPNREGLLETPRRVARSYAQLFSGYQYKTDEDIQAVLKSFEDGACDEMVLLKNVEFQSHCEHHMLPFVGRAHIAYLPNGRVVGISKLARILDVFSKRLQIQERLTQQITETLDKHLHPRGSACVIEAHHQCMSCRGVMKQNSVMVTSSITGEFRSPAVRQEFYSLISGGER